VEICSAEGTLLLPTDKEINGNFFFTAPADLHDCQSTGKMYCLSSGFQRLCLIRDMAVSLRREIPVWMWYAS
jgi:hypothetical protein